MKGTKKLDGMPAVKLHFRPLKENGMQRWNEK